MVLAMLEAFPDARIVTSMYAPDSTFPEFAEQRIETLLPSTPFSQDARLALPLLARAFSRHTIRDADVVLCSSSGWAHGVRSTAPKIVYCHTPARWLYQPENYALDHPWPVRLAARAAGLALTAWDARAARSAEEYLANSTVVAERIRRAYGRTADVVHPPHMLDPDGEQLPVPALEPGFLLTVSRRRGYKNTNAIAEAAVRHGAPLVVVGRIKSRHPNVVGLHDIDDSTLRWLYANCRALVSAAYEDFGLTPVEAMAFGKPTIALRAGGYLDSVVENVTGIFFDSPTATHISGALAMLDDRSFDEAAIRRESERFSLERFASALQLHVERATRAKPVPA